VGNQARRDGSRSAHPICDRVNRTNGETDGDAGADEQEADGGLGMGVVEVYILRLKVMIAALWN